MKSEQTRLLIIDTSTTFLSLGLHQHGETDQIYEAVGSKQSELILPAIQKLLQKNALTLPQLDAIVYAQGPGAFTGLRIGLGVATGLALPFGLPLMAIPTLDAVAAVAPPHRCVLAATDARMHELFYAWYDTASQTRLSDYQVGAAETITLPHLQTSGIGVGNAFALDISLPVTGQNIMPTARHYAQLALTERYPAHSAAQASLLYIRNKIALTTAEQAAQRQSKA